MLTKNCDGCFEDKTLNLFSPSQSNKLGVASFCRSCRNTYVARLRAEKAGRAYIPKTVYASDEERNFAKRLRYKTRYRKQSPQTKMLTSVRNAVWRTLNGCKNSRTFDLLGYSPADLKQHLEARFLPGMSWANYGEWHIDHKRPIASFNIRSAQDDSFKECWALSNLQPLWALDNIRKGASHENTNFGRWHNPASRVQQRV